jgi:hypothetical protein
MVTGLYPCGQVRIYGERSAFMWAGLNLWRQFCIHVGRFTIMVTDLHPCGQVCIYGNRSAFMWAGLKLW